MFSNFAWSEILVIAVVAIIVVGPKDLPGMLRQVGKALGSVRRMGNEFQRQFNDAIKEAELDDLKDLTSTKGFSPLDDAKKSMENFTKSVEDSVSDIDIGSDTSAAAPSPAKSKVAAKQTKSTATKATKPAARKPAAKKTAAKPAASKAPATRKPRTATAAKSGASKPATAKSGTTKSAAAKPRARKAPAKSAAKSTKSTT